MKRVAVTLTLTIVGLVLLLQFKVHTTKPSVGALATLSPTTSEPARASHPKRHHVGTASKSPAPTTTTKTPTPSTPSTSPTHKQTAPANRIVTGQTVQTQYGPVQVQIVETGHTLTDVTPLQLPNDSPHSQEIAAAAVPILRSEALSANSAHINVVSGANYTSDGYAQSLQSALDRA
jgi:uncharacterized protein with FMN-binding domain